MGPSVRVLVLVPHLGRGGAEKVATLVAGGLSQKKFEVHLGLMTPPEAGPELLPPWVTVHRLAAKRVRAGAIPLLRLVRRIRPSVILSGAAHLNFLVLLLRPLFPRKTRVLVRQDATVSSVLRFGNVPWYTSLLYRFLYRRADQVICQSRAMADDLARELRMGKERIAVLANPVDLDAIRAATRTRGETAPGGTGLGWTGPGPHLLAVGRLAHEKGFDLLLEALVTVRRRFPLADMIIAGAGPAEAALKAQCLSLGLADAVRLPGYVQRPYVFYAGASLFVLSSRYEGMPNAMLEAAAGGLPIVATPASGGVVDMLRNRPGAWLTREISAASLASTLLKALEERDGAQSAEALVEEKSPACARLEREPGFNAAITAYEELIDAACCEANPRRVAMVIPTLDRIAGAERQMMMLALGMSRRGWPVTVVTLAGAGGAAAEELNEAGVEFVSLGMRKGLVDPRGWTRFIGWLRRSKPDLVHAHLPHAAWLARWARLFAPVPVVIDTLHSSSTGGVGRHWGYRFSRKLPDQVTAVSRSVADSHLSARMVRRDTLTILPNGVDVEEWRPDELVRARLRRELGLEEQFLWLAAGRIETVKDYPTLLNAMAAVPPPARLVIAGDGPLLTNMARLASHLGICARVKFLGFEPNLKRWFQAADGFVHTSRWEGLPMALLEAAACALPTVATDVPGSREVVLHGETGILVPPADASALAWAMTAIMRTPLEERQRLGARARQRAVEHFSLASSIDRWEELYGMLLSRKSHGAAIQHPPHSRACY